jgi:hypothetical protein
VDGSRQDEGFVFQQDTLTESVIECPVVIEFVGASPLPQAQAHESVIECPVVIEFVGASPLPQAREEIMLAVTDQVANTVGRS